MFMFTAEVMHGFSWGYVVHSLHACVSFRVYGCEFASPKYGSLLSGETHTMFFESMDACSSPLSRAHYFFEGLAVKSIDQV